MLLRRQHVLAHGAEASWGLVVRQLHPQPTSQVQQRWRGAGGVRHPGLATRGSRQQHLLDEERERVPGTMPVAGPSGWGQVVICG